MCIHNQHLHPIKKNVFKMHWQSESLIAMKNRHTQIHNNQKNNIVEISIKLQTFSPIYTLVGITTLNYYPGIVLKPMSLIT